MCVVGQTEKKSLANVNAKVIENLPEDNTGEQNDHGHQALETEERDSQPPVAENDQGRAQDSFVLAQREWIVVGTVAGRWEGRINFLEVKSMQGHHLYVRQVKGPSVFVLVHQDVLYVAPVTMPLGGKANRIQIGVSDFE